jgi:hypothetical protein
MAMTHSEQEAMLCDHLDEEEVSGGPQEEETPRLVSPFHMWMIATVLGAACGLKDSPHIPRPQHLVL